MKIIALLLVILCVVSAAPDYKTHINNAKSFIRGFNSGLTFRPEYHLPAKCLPDSEIATLVKELHAIPLDEKIYKQPIELIKTWVGKLKKIINDCETKEMIDNLKVFCEMNPDDCTPVNLIKKVGQNAEAIVQTYRLIHTDITKNAKAVGLKVGELTRKIVMDSVESKNTMRGFLELSN